MLNYKELPEDMQNVSVIMNHLAHDMEHHKDKEPELLEKAKELQVAAAILLEWADKLQTQQENNYGPRSITKLRTVTGDS